MELLAGWQGPGLDKEISERLTRGFLSETNPSDGRNVLEPIHGTTLIAAGDDDNLLEFTSEDRLLFAIGSPLFAGREFRSADNSFHSLAADLRDDPHGTLSRISGCHALVMHERPSGRIILATDRFGSIPVYYFVAGDRSLVFSTTYASLLNHPLIGGQIDQQSVYNYIFFSTVPSDRCIHRDIRRIPPASVLVCEDGRVDVQRYWRPKFDRDDTVPAAELQQQTRDALSESVARFSVLEEPGCFLSGGLDSSAVAGMAAKHSGGKPFRAYTMGFTEAEFDETTYARTAAEQFGLDLREHRITADELVQTIDTITAAFAEPFGNSSAISSYIGAKVAREDGTLNILAGDGGDELFAGNERYQKQLVFELYQRVPRALRASILNPFAEKLSALPSPFSKISSYIRQAIIPLPARMFTYHLLVRNAPSEILSPVFLKGIDTEQPFRFLQSLFDEPTGGDTLDRMMFLDWTVTLTDNDLRKVRTTCDAAGLHVHFPMLEHSVVDTSLRVPSHEKMTMRTLRAFYKKAFTGFLPERILHKQKHGFGVPVGPWIAKNADLRERVYGSLGALKERDIIQPEYIDSLIHLHQTDHAIYYGALLWPLFMLEEWFQAHSRGE